MPAPGYVISNYGRRRLTGRGDRMRNPEERGQ